MKEYFSNNKALLFKNVPTLIAGMEHEMEWTWNGMVEWNVECNRECVVTATVIHVTGTTQSRLTYLCTYLFFITHVKVHIYQCCS